ncbi:MAG: ferritin [Proteobacteria bacterium]|nr:ferritin [Pseudomonadota bacterium]MBU1737928.1 ferritin [Pseudomonadota bacterium]
MISKKMEKALNGQINAELYSSYMYYSMSAWFANKGLPGFANWMKQQVQEEMFHGSKLFDFVNERGGRVILEAIDKPPTDWKSVQEVFAETLKHEQKVTGLINKLVDLAHEERDHATSIYLQWFVSEQVEEEAGVGAVLDKLKLIGKDSNTLFVLDQEMGQRIFTLPVPAK